MDIHTAAHYMKSGYRIKRSSWASHSYVYYDVISQQICIFVKAPTYSLAHGMVLTIDELLAVDWEIITPGIIKDFPLTYSD